MITQQEAPGFRTTAKLVGVVYLAGFAVGIGGNALIQSVLGGPNYLSTVSYETKLIPRSVAVWGMLGYASIFCGMMSEFMGSGMGLISSIPGGLWEVFVGVLLIAKGFRSPVPSRSRACSTLAVSVEPERA